MHAYFFHHAGRTYIVHATTYERAALKFSAVSHV